MLSLASGLEHRTTCKHLIRYRAYYQTEGDRRRMGTRNLRSNAADYDRLERILGWGPPWYRGERSGVRV